MFNKVAILAYFSQQICLPQNVRIEYVTSSGSRADVEG